MGPLPRLDGHVEVARRVGDLAEHRQIGSGQQAVAVRSHEEVERVLPVPPSDRRTCALDDAKSSVIVHRTPPESLAHRNADRAAPT